MEIIQLKQDNFQEAVNIASEFIRRGGVVVCPTDTVYGLIADASNKNAVSKLFKIKKRSVKKPVPIFVRDLQSAKQVAKINKNQENFLKKSWPGKITFILERRGKINLYGVDKETIGLRIPNYKLISGLLKITSYLTGTSANLAGMPASTRINEIISQFRYAKPQPDLVISARNLPKNKSSVVLDIRADLPKILRE